MSGLGKNIIATLKFYDFFERPLTGYEIHKYLLRIGVSDKPASFKETLDALKNDDSISQKIKSFGGFYFLNNKNQLVYERIKKEKTSIAKWRRAKKIAKILRFVPYIKMIAISGSLALANTRPQSDLDFFIVAKQSRIWLCRLFSIFITQLMGWRRHNGKIKDRACLNSYITDKALEIRTHDLYSASEYLHLIPLWGLGVYQNFLKYNQWIGEYFSQNSRQKNSNQRIIKNNIAAQLFSGAIELILNNQIGDWFERLAAGYQKQKILKNPKTGWPDSQIIFNNDCLIFHPIPKAPIVEAKMSQIK